LLELSRDFLLYPVNSTYHDFHDCTGSPRLTSFTRFRSISEALDNSHPSVPRLCWVHFDRRTHHLSLPFEFDAFVFFAWPIALPYYLYKTRGVRGFFLAAPIMALLLLPYVISLLISPMTKGLAGGFVP
jgi:hypothetical protein